MHDNLRVNRIIGTTTKGEVIDCIQKISLTYAVMADKTIDFGDKSKFTPFMFL